MVQTLSAVSLSILCISPAPSERLKMKNGTNLSGEGKALEIQICCELRKALAELRGLRALSETMLNLLGIIIGTTYVSLCKHRPGFHRRKGNDKSAWEGSVLS